MVPGEKWSRKVSMDVDADWEVGFWERTGHQEVEEGEVKEISKIETGALEGAEREARGPVEQAVCEHPERAAATCKEGSPVPPPSIVRSFERGVEATETRTGILLHTRGST